MPTNPTEDKPNWHVELKQANTTLGFVMVDNAGDENPKAFTMNPYPKMASKLAQGRSKYSDQNPPFTDVALNDFSGGLGHLHHDENETKYLDGKRADTLNEAGRVINGPQEDYVPGLRDFDQSMPGDISWQPLVSGGTTTVTTDFTSSAAYNANSVVVWLKRKGEPLGNITVEIQNSAGTTLKSKTIAATTALDDYVSERVEFEFSSVQALSDATAYKVHISYTDGDSNDYVEVGVDSSDDLFYRVLDDTSDFNVIFLEYFGGLYAITQPSDRSASKMYIWGDRGQTDSNSGDKSLLNDASKSWTADEWIGAYVKIVDGTGLEEDQTYRKITDNDSTSVTVDDDWVITHDTTGEYVIYGNKFTLVHTFSYYVTDVTVFRSKYVVVAMGGDNSFIIYKYDNGADETHDPSIGGAQKVMATTTRPQGGIGGTLYTGFFEDIDLYDLPYDIGDIKWIVGPVHDPGEPFDSEDFIGVNNYVDNGDTFINVASSTTGEIARLTFDTPQDWTDGRYVQITLANLSSLTAGQLQFGFADADGNKQFEDIPALSVGSSTQTIELDPKPNASESTVDGAAVTDIYFKLTSAWSGNIILPSQSPIKLMGHGTSRHTYWFDENSRLNNIFEYAGGSGQIEKKPWLFYSNAVYYIENGFAKELYLQELEELEHPLNGMGVTKNDVYMYFNLADTIQRFYSGQLESIWPAGYGLPEERQGFPITLASYPNKVLAGIDAYDGTSNIVAFNQVGWHEIYRAPTAGDRIRSIHVYAMPGTADRIFFSEGADIGYVQSSINPETETDYEYTHESVIETGRIYGGTRGVENYFHSVELVTEDLDANTWIEVDYKVSGDSSWTPIGLKYDSSPREKHVLTEDYDETGSWIQLRFRMYTSDNAITPVLEAAILETLERQDVNYSYSIAVRLPKAKHYDLKGNKTTKTGDEMWEQLREWVNGLRPATVSSVLSDLHGEVCMIEPMTNYRIIDKQINNEEVRLFTLNLLEMI